MKNNPPVQEEHRPFQRRFARTKEELLSHLELNIQACTPGMLDTDVRYRRTIIEYLRVQHGRELRQALKRAEVA